MIRTHTILAVAAFLVAAGCGSKGDRGPAGTPGQPNSGRATGLEYEIQSVTLRNGAAPQVKFKVTDDAGNPIVLKNADSTLAFTQSITLARRGADGRFVSELTRSVNAKPYVGANGQTVQPALPSAIQAVAESTSGGADRLTGGEGGVYTYTFAQPLASVDNRATYRAGIWGSRTVDGVAFPASHTLDFVPGGGTPSGGDLVVDEQCQRCHGRVRAHGDQRLGVKLCITCHETQGTPEAPMMLDPETGNSVYMPTMIHRIHRGKELQNGYTIVGFAPNNPAVIPNSSVLAFGEHVTMAPSQTSYLELTAKGTGAEGAVPVNDPGIIRRCDLCHGEQAATVLATQSLSKCAGCHDKINPATGAGHTAGPQPDGSCANCHNDAAVAAFTTAHSETYESTRNVNVTPTHTVEVKIDDVKNAIAGQNPQIEFTIKVDGQPYDISTKPLAALGFQAAGPATDYREVLPTTAATSTNIAVSPGVASALNAVTAPAISATANMGTGPGKVEAIDAANGKFRFTMPDTAKIPVGRTGSYVFSYEAIFKETKNGPNFEKISKPYSPMPVFHGATKNVQYRNVNDGSPGPERRSVVANDKCNNCHVDLGFHGNRSRKGIDYCATCHDPNLDNRGRMRFQGPVGTKLLVESVSANVYIHRIHMGSELPSVQAGGTYQLGAIRTAGVAGPEQWATDNNGEEGFADFRRFESPRPVFACDTCHVPNGNALPTSAGRLPIRRALVNCDAVKAAAPDAGWCSTRSVAQETFTPPTTAVCTGCHDSPEAKTHAAINTVFPAGQTAETYNPYATGTSGAIDPQKEAVEGCVTCHGVGRDFDVVKIHTGPTFLQ